MDLAVAVVSVWSETVAWLTDAASWQGPDGVPSRAVEHLGLTAAGLGAACLIALPVALWLGHVGRGGVVALNVANVGRAVPVYALLVLLVIGPLGATTTSTVVALTAFGVPPIMTNAYVGVREVDRDVVDAARGAGMSGHQVLLRVELPLAAPLVMNGVRLAAVQIVATATIAALVGGGGLGRIISAGFGERDDGKLVAGALLVAVLALAVEGALALVQRLATGHLHEEGRRGGRGPAAGRDAGLAEPHTHPAGVVD